jgi:shikimate dehydrogenase
MTNKTSPSAGIFNLGLIGYPVEHSLSPQLHNAALSALNIEGSYNVFPILPLPEGLQKLKYILDRVRQSSLHGLNVTIPHKQSVIPLLDNLTPTAEAIGAVNTIYLQDSQLLGDNTDAPGFLRDLHRFLENIPFFNTQVQKSALILGAGGSARAVVYSLYQTGWQVFIAARRIEQAQALAGAMQNATASSIPDNIKKSQTISPLSLTTSSLVGLNPDLIVNTTPLGMSSHSNETPLPEGFSLASHSVVYDLVYSPPETALIKQSAAQGNFAVNGAGMLVEQAALSFERWTCKAAPRAIMHEIISSHTNSRNYTS